MDLGLNLQLSM